jgi:MscS family membrane protein
MTPSWEASSRCCRPRVQYSPAWLTEHHFRPKGALDANASLSRSDSRPTTRGQGARDQTCHMRSAFLTLICRLPADQFGVSGYAGTGSSLEQLPSTVHSKLITFGVLPALALALISTSAIAGNIVAAESAAPAATAPPAEAAATNAPPTVPVPDDPLGRGTPRSSVEGFFVAAREGDFPLASRYLDLSSLSADAQASQGPRLARQLWFVLERQAKIDFSALSINPLGEASDGLPPNLERLVRIEWRRGFADVNLERVREPNGLEVWKVSSRSVEQIPKLYERFRLRWADPFFSETTVDSILETHLLGLSGVTWITLAVVLCIWAIASLASLKLAGWSIKRMRPGAGKRLLSTIYVPVTLLIVTTVVRSLAPQRVVSAETASFFRAQTLLIVVVVWILFRFVDFASDRARARLFEREGTSGFNLIDLLRRIAKVTLVLIGLTVWLDNMGFRVTTIVASLGIIGLAVGLASKNFIEDLIAAMTLHATGVVKRNEAIRFGDQIGAVEDIGLRMTTIRARDRTTITMPNATFAAMRIENFARRDKILFFSRLGLRYETTPDQLRYVLIELRKLLYAHPKVLNDNARVRFVRFGAYSLDLDIFCYIRETDHAEYLAVAEDLNLRIMDIVAQAGTSFAFPSRTIYYERGEGLDEARWRQAESEVRRWREEGQLFQHKFPEEQIKEMTGTLKYPDNGVTDGRRQSSDTNEPPGATPKVK